MQEFQTFETLCDISLSFTKLALSTIET